MSSSQPDDTGRRRFLLVHDASVGIDARGPLRDIALAVTDAGIDVHAACADDHAHAAELLAEARAHYDAALIAGDSTLLPVAAHHAGPDLPIALLPIASGTGAAAQCGLRSKPRQIAASLAQSVSCPVTPLDLLNVADPGAPTRTAFAGVGIASDAELLATTMAATLPSRISKSGGLGMTRSLSKPPARFDVAIDGMNYRCTAIAVLARHGFGRNLLTDAGKADLAPDAPLVCVRVETTDRTSLFDLSLSAKFGRFLRDKAVTVSPAHEVEAAGAGLFVAMDGNTPQATSQPGIHVGLVPAPSWNTLIVAAELTDLLPAPAPAPQVAAA